MAENNDKKDQDERSIGQKMREYIFGEKGKPLPENYDPEKPHPKGKGKLRQTKY